MPRTITNPGTGSLTATHPSTPWSSLSDARQKEKIDLLRSTIIQDLKRAWILDRKDADPQGRMPIYFFDCKGALEAACLQLAGIMTLSPRILKQEQRRQAS